jgi:hypothetical protein
MDGDFDRDVLAAADMSPRNLEGEFAEVMAARTPNPPMKVIGYLAAAPRDG